ncbi:MAG: response regulator [Spirochaetales bacterium]|nr:response regulator [Spirochaetales bacterium]
MGNKEANEQDRERLDEYMAELEKARQDLEVREENLRKTINLIGYAVIYGDGEGRILRMNHIAQVLTETTDGEVDGHSLDQVFSLYRLPTRTALSDPFKEVLESGQVVTGEDNIVLVNRGGREFNVEYSAAPNLYNKEDDIEGMVLVIKDVTEQYLRHEQIGQIQKMDVVGQLAGGIAHDFNNMLGGILGAAELLRKRLGEDPKSLEYSDIIINATGRAAELTQELVSFATKQRSSSTYVDMHRIVEDAVKILKGTIDPRVDILLDLGADDSVLGGNQSQLQNVIVNLGTNAYHAMPAGGRISISTAVEILDEETCKQSPFSLKAGPFLRLDFSDTGSGIPAHLVTKIFEPFFTTKDKMKGTGLGLAAVYGIIKQHGGSIEVDSVMGQGTRFRILLPLEQGGKSGSYGSSDLIHGKGTIMVVDDEFIMRMTAKNILEELGYEITLVENGRDAVNLYKVYGDSFDLVVLDMIMPIMDGKDCFEELIRIDPAVKVVLSTGLTGGDAIEDMKKKGLKGFISKPYLSYELSHIVHKILSE